MKRLNLVIPTILKDFETCKININYFFELLPIDQIVIVGSEELRVKVEELTDKRIVFIDENSIYSLHKVRKMISSYAGVYGLKEENALKRAGWYYQQFLKILYSYHCEDEYYFIWDSDTVPVHKVVMFDEDEHPFFDIKTEYHKPYFITIEKLFGLQKAIKYSFISEHMVFHTQTVRKMIIDIEQNKELEGKDFVDKVLKVVASTGFEQLAFSEFETYGTYAYSYFPDFYKLRKWKSLRRGVVFRNR